MNNLIQLSQFAKGKIIQPQTRNSKNAVIYTRVSSKEQAETNQSLETQKKYCLEYALKHNLNILGFFGGTYESAKTDERNEFNRMIRFVKNQREGVALILVFSLDRFSRTGDNAIFISAELKRRGISIVSVTQPIDVSTHTGVLQQNIQFIFSKYDNDLRREKCIAGMKEKLKRGEWIGGVPIGFSYDRTSREQRIITTVHSGLIRQAFEWKAQGVSNTEIAEKLSRAGLIIGKKRLSETFRNPFYCGYLSHSFLEGQILKGKHDGIISEELFLRANNALSKNAYGYKQEQKNGHTPLKNYVRCHTCGTPFTAYLVKAKGLYYYKCNKIGCKCNRSAKRMHDLYIELLQRYQIDPDSFGLLKEQLLMTYEHLTESRVELQAISSRSLGDLTRKLETLENRFAFGEIDRDLYLKVSEKLKAEIRVLDREMEDSKNQLSNPAKFIEHALKICSNLINLWLSAPYEQKVKLQELFFPGGIRFDREIEHYRTEKVNAILELTHYFSTTPKENKKGQIRKFPDLSGSVVPAGIEPASSESESEILSIVLRNQ